LIGEATIFHQVQKSYCHDKKQIKAFNQVLAGTPVPVEDQSHKRIKWEVAWKAQSRSSRLAAARAASLEQASPTIDQSARSREKSQRHLGGAAVCGQESSADVGRV
jgi:hypothetical protein